MEDYKGTLMTMFNEPMLLQRRSFPEELEPFQQDIMPEGDDMGMPTMNSSLVLLTKIATVRFRSRSSRNDGHGA